MQTDLYRWIMYKYYKRKFNKKDSYLKCIGYDFGFEKRQLRLLRKRHEQNS